MKSYGLTLCLQDDPAKIEEYKRYHEAVWPEVIAKIREVGIERMQIFLRGRRMFMYIDTADDFDLKAAWARIMENPKSVEWEYHLNNPGRWAVAIRGRERRHRRGLWLPGPSLPEG